MRKLLPLAAVSALVLALGACSKPAPEETATPEEPAMAPSDTDAAASDAATDAAEATPTDESGDRGMMANPDANPGDRP
jgi:hypothetical protein